MAQAAAGGAPTGAAGGGSAAGVGQNPFQIATNLYAEKNLQGLQTSLNVTSSQQQFGGSINAGQFLRGLRLMVRCVTPGTFTVINGRTPGTQTDGAFDLIANADLINVDGSEILYNMSAYSHYIMEKYAKPWKKDRALAYDYQPPVSTTSIGAFTLPLFPEIRWTAGVLANTDTRSQYRFDYTISAVTSTVTPAINVTPYMDAWAQPDANDLQGTPNQPVPPGVNLQVKRRHQLFSINSGADNTILSTLTGNAIRCMALIARNTGSQSVRVDGFSDPLYWYLDNRSLGRLNPDIVRQWAEDQYTTYDVYGAGAASYATNPNFYGTAPSVVDGVGAATANYAGAPSEDFGVAVFPRFIEPGELYGQGWLYTANSTKLAWETVAANSANQYELVVDEVYPVGNVDPSLVDI